MAKFAVRTRTLPPITSLANIIPSRPYRTTEDTAQPELRDQEFCRMHTQAAEGRASDCQLLARRRLDFMLPIIS